jgi:VIT1/CCC1 family predicted Fe2+/Mn2+ transporter
MTKPLDTPIKASWVFAVVGILLTAFIGYFIGVLIEHPIGEGGLPFVGALIGILIASDILFLGQALNSRK